MATSTESGRPKAFSYIRMSTDAQLKGDSHRRQLETSDKYIASNGLELIERLSDLGVSAFRGANVEYGALGRFLQAVSEGKVEAGSYLIVEALDRISRQPTRIALQLFLELMNKDRTSMQRFQDFIMSLAKTTADATEELEPTWKWARLIAAIFGVRQDIENAKLPPPPKRIEKPKQQLPPPSARRNGARRADMDDDIPF
jgi:DNA invertase Pin-like site-specific DNA recombinase